MTPPAASVKREKNRVEVEARRLLRRLSVKLTFIVEKATAEELAEHSGAAILLLGRTARGRDDDRTFSLSFDPVRVAARSRAELQDDVLHEVLHALTFDLYDEALEAARTEKEREAARRLWERTVYELEEIVAPLLRRNRRSARES